MVVVSAERQKQNNNITLRYTTVFNALVDVCFEELKNTQFGNYFSIFYLNYTV